MSYIHDRGRYQPHADEDSYLGAARIGLTWLFILLLVGSLALTFWHAWNGLFGLALLGAAMTPYFRLRDSMAMGLARAGMRARSFWKST